MTTFPLTAPYSTKKLDAAWRKRVREEYREARAQNPKLMRRLGKLTDDQLNRLLIAVLELEPPSASRNDELRLSLALERIWSMPKVKRGGKVARLRDPRQHCTQPETPIPLGGLTPPPTVQPTNTVEADKSGPPAAPPAPAEPSNNVIRADFGPKAFGIGRESFWIGGEF